jgi:hypothetical protein
MAENNKLIIEALPDGSISVSGPIGKKMMCYGMLEMAKEAIHDYNLANQRLVQPVSILPEIRKEQ